MGIGVAQCAVGHLISQHSAFADSPRRVANEGAAAAARLDHAGGGEFVVGLEHRVGVYAELGGQRSERGEGVANHELTAGDGGADRVGDLDEDGSPVVGLQRNVLAKT
jgi:hypothetical protein